MNIEGYCENVRNLIPQSDEDLDKKHSIWKSKYSPYCPPTASTFGLKGTSLPGIRNLQGESTAKRMKDKSNQRSALYGPPIDTIKPNPKAPLTKHSKAHTIPSLKEYKKIDPCALTTSRKKVYMKPAIPNPNDRPIYGIKSNQDFVATNIVDNMLARPPKPIEPMDFLRKPEYGQVPKYLEQCKASVEEAYRTIKSTLNKEHNMQGDSHTTEYELDDQERSELLKALKQQREEVNTQYQYMTFKTKLDTLCQIRKKEQYEESLAAFDKYIEMFSKSAITIVDK